jgi:hypothetical protein
MLGVRVPSLHGCKIGRVNESLEFKMRIAYQISTRVLKNVTYLDIPTNDS